MYESQYLSECSEVITAMFVRLIIIIILIHYSKCGRCSIDRHLRHLDDFSPEDADEIENIFDYIVDVVSEIDEKMEKTCRFSSITALDKFDQIGYTRKIILAGYNKDTVSVKIKGRVMLTKVDHMLRNRKGLVDIKILHHNLNNTEATYEITDDNLYVNIPYLNDFLGFCQRKVYENVINVLPDDVNVEDDDPESEPYIDIRYNVPFDKDHN